MDDDAYIVVIEPSGFMGSVTIIDRRYAAKAAQQLRVGGRRVRVMNREEYLSALSQDVVERRRNIWLMNYQMGVDV